MRLLPSMAFLGVFICAPGAAQMLTSEPAAGTLRAGAVVYVDDGTCGAGQVKQVIGGNPSQGIRRQVSCVNRHQERHV